MTAVLDSLRCGAELSVAKALCVFVHGRGQSPEEMQARVLARLNTAGVAFVLPRAPGSSWYAAKAVDPLTPETRAALADGLAHLRMLIEDARAACPGRPLLLAGFSQGACLALEYAFSGLPAPDALVALTGCRVGVSGDTRPQALRPGLPVYLTGADADPWIPVDAFAGAALALGRGRAALRADLFPGREHEVSDPEVAMLSSILADLVAGRATAMEAAR